ncbi:MAG TPA: hypothetical protein PLE35_07525, partial [Lentisphaeria bacterium]|nr:hypothetical protein [Lentisphaeria bacterium]
MSEFSIPYCYETHYTEDVFAPANDVLWRALQGVSAAPVRVFFVVEEELQQFYPDLLASIAGYCRAHADAVCLTAPPLLQAGGEHCKDIAVSL